MKFEIYNTQPPGLLAAASGQQGWRWRLRGDNGEPIANGGESYTTKENCLRAIGLVIATTPLTPIVETPN